MAAPPSALHLNAPMEGEIMLWLWTPRTNAKRLPHFEYSEWIYLTKEASNEYLYNDVPLLKVYPLVLVLMVLNKIKRIQGQPLMKVNNRLLITFPSITIH